MKDAFCILLVVVVIACYSILWTGTNSAEGDIVDETTPVVETGAVTEAPATEAVAETEYVEPTEIETSYTEEELDLLARIINAEAGSSWIPDEVQLYVGSVVLNRVKSDRFPDTIKDVIYQKGQYSPTWNGSINKKPSQRAIDNAKYLLENGSVLPDGVVFQANFRQGSSVYYKYYDKTLGTTTYFCYI